MQEPLPLINPDNLAPDVPDTVKVQIGKQWREQRVSWKPQPVLYDMQDRGYTLPKIGSKPLAPKRGWLDRLSSFFGA